MLKEWLYAIGASLALTAPSVLLLLTHAGS